MPKLPGVPITAPLLLLLALAAVPVLQSQVSSPLIPRTKEQRERQYEAQRQITLSAVVADASGAPVSGLKTTDFSVTENGKASSIVRFQEVSKPTALQVHGLIVLDAINNGGPAVNRERKELKNFLAQQKVLPFPLAIVIAAGGAAVEGDPSTDPAVLLRDLDARSKDLQGSDCVAALPVADLGSRMGGGAAGNTEGSGQSQADCKLGQFIQSMNALHQLLGAQQKVSGRSIVIWLGPGWPIPETQESGVIMGSATQARAGDIAIGLSTDLQLGVVTFDGVSWSDYARPRGPRRKEAPAQIQAASLPEQEAMLTIPALSQQSGGLALPKTKNISDAINRCLQDGNSFYILAFDPASATTADDHRTINVTVDRPGVTVRALQSYFQQP